MDSMLVYEIILKSILMKEAVSQSLKYSILNLIACFIYFLIGMQEQLPLLPYFWINKDAFSSAVKVPQDKVSIKCVWADTCEPDQRRLNRVQREKERSWQFAGRWVNGHLWSQLEPASPCNSKCRQLTIIRIFTRNTTVFQNCFQLSW